MRYVAVVLSLVLSFGGLALAQEGTAPPVETPPPAETPQAEPALTMPDTPEAAQRLLDALKLTPEQSMQLLELLDQIVANRDTARLAQADELEQLAAALRANADREALQQIQANALAAALQRQAEQAGLTLRVRALFTQDQLAVLQGVLAVERALEPGRQGQGFCPRGQFRDQGGFGPQGFGRRGEGSGRQGFGRRGQFRDQGGFGRQGFGPGLRGGEGGRRFASQRGGADPIIHLLTRPAFLEALRNSQPQQ